MNKRNILIILENKPGALARVVGLFHQRGYNIASLHVDAVEDVSQYSWLAFPPYCASIQIVPKGY